MFIINVSKMLAIWLTDIVNRLINPFEERRFEERADLRELESRFATHLERNFKDETGLFMYQKPMPEDRGDHALFQGLYIAYRALKGNLLEGEIWGIPAFFVNNRLIRGRYADGRINDTTSNDSATGMLFGLYCMWQYQNSKPAKELIVKWAQQIIDDGYALADSTGKPTKYGQLENGIKTDPLRITLLLALLSLASRIDRKFIDIYETIYQKHREILPYPKVRLLWLDTDYDTHRAAIHLHILWELTRDTIYKDGLKRLHSITRKENNAWVQVLCSPVIAPEELNLTILNTFEYDARIRGNVAVDPLEAPKTVKWGKHTRCVQTLPIRQRGSQEFFWQRNMFSYREWAGNTTPYAYHSGLDFLLVYWMGKRLGLTSQLSGVIL